MHKFAEEKDWQGNAEALARHALEWMRTKRIGDPSFEPNERLVRDYVARGILSKPERKGKEAIFGFEQLAQFLACRAVIDDGWPLSKISEDFRVSSMTEILNLIPGEASQDDALSLVENFKADALFDSAASTPKRTKSPEKGHPKVYAKIYTEMAAKKDAKSFPKYAKTDAKIIVFFF